MGSIVRREDNEYVIDLKAVFRLLFRKLPIILLAMAVGTAVTLAYSIFMITPKYEAGVTLYVNNRGSDENAQSVTSSDLTASAQLVGTYTAIIQSNTMLKQVISQAGSDSTPEQLSENMTISAVNNTEVFKIKVLDPDPKMATRLANAVASIAPKQISEIVEGSSVQVVDSAEVSDKIATPSYKKWGAIGALVGMIFSIAIIFIVAFNDTGIKTEADFDSWDYPLLCSIPDLSAKAKGGYGYGYRKGRK